MGSIAAGLVPTALKHVARDGLLGLEGSVKKISQNQADPLKAAPLIMADAIKNGEFGHLARRAVENDSGGGGRHQQVVGAMAD